jgi:hypothetical protein
VSVKSQFGEDWHDQWRRVERWYRRLEPISADPPETEPEKSDALDVVFAFFMNCFHLCDWLENDPTAPPGAGAHVKANKALRICRDLCNGLKHYRLDPRRSTTTYQRLGTTGTTMTQSSPGRWWIELEPGGERLDMFGVAAECMALWARFVGEPPVTAT